MKRISKEEFDKIMDTLHKLNLNIHYRGGIYYGGYAYYLDDFKIGWHQVDYEKYWELDEELYDKYINLDLSKCNSKI